MNWQFYVALRYLTAKRKEKFISLISLISILGVALGVAALIIVISVMSGFDETLQDKIIGTYSHIEILSDYGIRPTAELVEAIMRTKHVMATSHFLNGQALIRSGDNVMGAVVKGIIPSREVRVNSLGQYVKEGSLNLDDDGIAIGSELANRLNVKLGDAVTLISSAHLQERKRDIEGKRFRVVGTFTSGMYDYDMNVVYIGLAKAQGLFGTRDLISGISIRIDDIFNAASVKSKLQNELGLGYIVRTWIDANKNFLEALKLEKTAIFVIVALTIIVACFNITATLIMTVLEKTKDIGILKAIGATNFNIMLIFAINGEIIGVLGTALGSSLGIITCWCLKTYRFITLPSFYYIDKLPAKLDPLDISIIIVSSLVISLIATIYPAHKASQLDPVEALRYE